MIETGIMPESKDIKWVLHLSANKRRCGSSVTFRVVELFKHCNAVLRCTVNGVGSSQPLLRGPLDGIFHHCPKRQGRAEPQSLKSPIKQITQA